MATPKEEPKLRQQYTIHQILDYMDCSLCYHLKNVKKLEPPAGTLVEDKNILYQECIQEAIRYYYLEHQQGKPPALKAVYDKFYSLWMDKTDTRERNSIFTRTLEEGGKHGREERSRYVTKGYETLQKFYAQNARKKQAILAVNHLYEIILDDISLVGEFELIREVMGKQSKRREIEIVTFQTTTRKADDDMLKRDLTLTAMHYAFYETFQTMPDNFILNYINREEELFITRDANEYKRMFSILTGFVQSVNTVDPFPRPGAHRRFSPYKEYCDNYRF